MSDNEQGPRESAYDEHFQPAINKLIALAREHDIAFFFTVRLDDKGDRGLLRCHTIVPHRADDGIASGETPEEFSRALVQVRNPVDRAAIAMVHAEARAGGPDAIARLIDAVRDD